MHKIYFQYFSHYISVKLVFLQFNDFFKICRHCPQLFLNTQEKGQQHSKVRSCCWPARGQQSCSISYQSVHIFRFVDEHPYLLWISTEDRLDQWWLQTQGNGNQNNKYLTAFRCKSREEDLLPISLLNPQQKSSEGDIYMKQ